ncbi:MAG: preprotein translocase subunit YajC [Thermoguttaceae bacterium]|nr:preprotein translocase subunit YajC [Thermoguttaceae bacterium]
MTVLSTLPTFASLFADAPAPAPTPAGSGPFAVVMMTFVMLIVMWLLIVLPKKSQDKKAQALIDSIKINDKVMTTAGIIGTVSSIDRDGGEIVLRVDDATGAKIRFALGAVCFVFNKEAAKEAKEAAKDKQAKKK